jgi:hypothetical protein
MPQKINMFITNGNVIPKSNPSIGINYANLAVAPTTTTTTTAIAPSQLNSSMIGRIHSIKPGCGSCGRK